MKHFTIIAALAAIASAHWVASNGSHFHDPHSGKTIQHFGCGAKADKAHKSFLDAVKELHHGKHSKGGSRAAALAKKQVPNPISVPTYFHVISSTANAGTITQDMANAQIATLNTAYNPNGISFTLVNTSFTTNDAWAVAAGTDMDALKAALRVGTYSNLNLYFHTDLAGGNLGTCTLPSQVPAGSDPSVHVSDGCNVNANTMPGGTMEGYNMGMTAVHETGHWLGLLHTFEGYACDGDGDFIDDTPFESVSTSGCPDKPPKDSCPTVTGVDPIHNYMDYSTDACYEAFTPGQVARIASMWTQFREGM
jgi:hypothetical protein